MKAIMYHYVRYHQDELPYFKFLHFDDFQKQLEYFGNEYGFVDRDKFIECFNTGELEKGVILTFDDGFKDHYEYVYPEIKKRGLWGIFYISTMPLVERRFIDVHRVHLLLGSVSSIEIAKEIKTIVTKEMLSQEYVDSYYDKTYKSQSNDQFTLFVKRCLNYYIKSEYRVEVLERLEDKFSSQVKQHAYDDFYLGEEEIREMNEAGMIIGSHSVSHPVMSKLSLSDQEREIKESFNKLESVTNGLSIKTFCYPYGGYHTFTRKTENILDKNRIVFSFNVEPRDIQENDIKNRRHALPRYDCNFFPFGQCR